MEPSPFVFQVVTLFFVLFFFLYEEPLIFVRLGVSATSGSYGSGVIVYFFLAHGHERVSHTLRGNVKDH